MDRKTGKRRKKRWNRFGDEERRLMHLVPAPAVRLKKRRVLSRPGVNSLLALGFLFLHFFLIPFISSFLLSAEMPSIIILC